jgi:hypothetical protein
VVVEDDVYVEVVGDLAVDLVRERDEVRSGWHLRRSVMTLPVATSRAANRSTGAVADVVVGRLLRGGGWIGRIGADRLSAWICGFSSTA